MGRQGTPPGIPGYLVFQDSSNPPSHGTPRDIPGILVFRDSPSHGTPRDTPRNPGILSIPGLKESTLTWDTKGHPGNSGILSIPGLKQSTLTLGRQGTSRESRDTFLGYSVMGDSRILSYGTPRDILGILGCLVFGDSRNPPSYGTSQESQDTIVLVGQDVTYQQTWVVYSEQVLLGNIRTS